MMACDGLGTKQSRNHLEHVNVFDGRLSLAVCDDGLVRQSSPVQQTAVDHLFPWLLIVLVPVLLLGAPK